jgi:hypothetical protein
MSRVFTVFGASGDLAKKMVGVLFKESDLDVFADLVIPDPPLDLPFALPIVQAKPSTQEDQDYWLCS